MYDINELNAKKVDELKALAKDLSLRNFNKLKKEDLVYQILDAQAEQPEAVKETRDEKPKRKPAPKKVNTPIKDTKKVANPAAKKQENKPMKKASKPAEKKVADTKPGSQVEMDLLAKVQQRLADKKGSKVSNPNPYKKAPVKTEEPKKRKKYD